MLTLLSLCVLVADLSGTEVNEAKSMSAIEGDSVTLHTGLTEIHNDDTILWTFGPKESFISHLTRKADFTSVFVTDDVEFRGILEVKQNTGSLTIRNARVSHTGSYKVIISREKTTLKIFNITVFEKSTSVSVMEGDSVTLHTKAELYKDATMMWSFVDEAVLLAVIDLKTNETSINVADERFSDRLELDYQTGSLTIRNARAEQAGLYEVQVRGRESSQQFLLSVSAPHHSRLPAGAIAGIIIIVLLMAAFVTFIIVYYYRRKIAKLEHVDEVVVEAKVAEVKEKEGRTHCLRTGMKLQEDDEIKWWFNTNLIAKFSGGNFTSYESDNVRFKGKLSRADKYGDLLITNIRSIHSGVYKVEAKGKSKIITVNVEDTEVPVELGDTLIFNTHVETLPGDLILWTFGATHQLIKAESGEISINDERYRERLELDPQTGSLTIRNITDEDYGYFHLQIINKKRTRFRRFKVVKETTRRNVSNEQQEERIQLQPR